MKILSLNTWGGRIRPQIYDFLSQQAKTVDVFCLQEVYYDPSGKSIKDFSDKIPHDINMLDTLREILPDYDIFFASLIHEIYGIVMCSRKGTHPLMYQEYQVGGPDIWIPLEDRT